MECVVFYYDVDLFKTISCEKGCGCGFNLISKHLKIIIVAMS